VSSNREYNGQYTQWLGGKRDSVQNLESVIRNSIERVNADIRKHPLAFLTESDIQCRLYAALLSAYGSIEPVSNMYVWGTTRPRPLQPIQSMRLHSELLLSEGRIDLAVLDLCATRYAFNSKGRFGHVQLESGSHAFIEIKVSRTHRSGVSTRARWLHLLRADLEKLSRYSWLSFLLAYDFDFQLPQDEISALSKLAGPHTCLLYLKDDFECCYFEKMLPNKALNPDAPNSGAPVS
jgi:hypothetical protein